MKEILKSKTFIGAFLLIYFSFFFMTIVVFDIKSESFCVECWGYGFPFTYYFSSCWGGGYRWAGLFGNILFAGVLGVAGGVALTYLRRSHPMPFYRKASSKEFRKKWYIQ